MSDVSFYETSAQVVPLLLLAAAVETRFLEDLRPFESRTERTRHAVSDAILLPLAVVILFAGEAAALHVSLVGTASWLEKRLTVVALLLGFWGLFTPILNQVIVTTMNALEEANEAKDGTPQVSGVAAKAGLWASKVMHAAIIAMGVLVMIGYAG